jgi:hypothetical protein
MIKQQLLFALRRLGWNKLTTTINVLGLTFGILSCLVIYLYVTFEFSYDKFHKDSNRIYRVIVQLRRYSWWRWRWRNPFPSERAGGTNSRRSMETADKKNFDRLSQAEQRVLGERPGYLGKLCWRSI